MCTTHTVTVTHTHTHLVIPEGREDEVHLDEDGPERQEAAR